jgi:glyoxylase-like metal-dependent hydrolase (beta-lactamase superfamily II)
MTSNASPTGGHRSVALTLVLLGLAGFAAVSAQGAPPGEPPVGPTGVKAVKVQGNVWMLAGAGGNIAVQAGDEGVLVVDAGAAGSTDAVIAAIRGISDRPIRYLVNTSLAAQHVGGNAVLAALPGGSTSGGTRGAMIRVTAQENVFIRMSRPGVDGQSPFPAVAWPSDAYYAPQRNIVFNGEVVDIVHQPAAHSDGDSLVYFRGSNVLVAGDLYTTTSLPLVNRALGGTLKGTLAALNRMLDIAVSDDLAEGGTYVIPGHGRISDEADLVEYRDMVHVVSDRLAALVGKERLTRDQVKERRPLIGWEQRYSRPEWTTGMFIDAVYDEFAGGQTR